MQATRTLDTRDSEARVTLTRLVCVAGLQAGGGPADHGSAAPAAVRQVRTVRTVRTV